MAPFNQRQIGYIQAIAGRQQHRTLVCGQDDGQLNSETALAQSWRKPQTLAKDANDNELVVGGVTSTQYNTSGLPENAKSLLLHTWHLDHPELGFDSRTVHQNNTLESADFSNLWSVAIGLGAGTTLDVFNAPVKGTYTLFDQPGNQGTIIQDDTDPQVGNQSALPAATGELLKNPDLISSIHRATPDGFMNSTDVKFRFTLPTDISTQTGVNPMGQTHYEFRWIVWRSKKPTARGKVDNSTANRDSNMDIIRNGCSFRHPGYDLFMGQTGRKRGFLGYTWNPNLDGDAKVTANKNDPDSEAYSGKFLNAAGNQFSDGVYSKLYPEQEIGFTVDDVMTCRLNRDDYVIMKDVRFFLGKEHGKSHFEDNLHWDWNDPIDTPDDNMLTSPTLNTKNYRWHMTLLGTTGGKNAVKLNHTIRWTTKSESG